MISYKPLFRLLLEKDMTKTQLREAVGFGTVALAKMSKNEYISLETIDKICDYFNCNIDDVIEHLPWSSDQAEQLVLGAAAVTVQCGRQGAGCNPAKTLVFIPLLETVSSFV